MAMASPRWEKSVDPPNASISKSTTDYVENDLTCTAKLLQGPPPAFIQSLLRIEINVSEHSPLMLAIEKSENYFSIRSSLSKKTMPNRRVPEKNENDYAGIVEGSLQTLVPLAALILLQFWLQDGDSNDLAAFDSARSILMSLDTSSVIRDTECMPRDGKHIAFNEPRR